MLNREPRRNIDPVDKFEVKQSGTQTTKTRAAAQIGRFQVDALERDALEILSLVRSVKNSLAPINRIPTEVLSLIPDYFDEDEGDADQDLITLTHVSRGWRNIFVSRSSLWTRLDCMDVDKTRTYIQRSESSPLEIFFENGEGDAYPDDAFALVIPHIHRIKSLTIRAYTLPAAIIYFSCRTPLLEKLDIRLTCTEVIILNDSLFDRDLSSLRELTLSGVVTHLPWKNLTNLTSLDLTTRRPGKDLISQLLDFFENAPLLRTIKLKDAIPKSSDAPSGRVVSLPHLSILSIDAYPAHSILLDHLCIPTGALVILRFEFAGATSPLRNHLPETIENLGNLSHITTINLRFGATEKFIQMEGPSGALHVLGRWKDRTTSAYNMDRRIIGSLVLSVLLTTNRLAIWRYKHPRPAKGEICPIPQMLSPMSNLRILMLAECHNLPFILALSPEKNDSNFVLCPALEELILYIKTRDQFHIKPLTSMAKGRASRDAKLLSITIVGMDELLPGKEVFKLREHIKHVEYRVDDTLPNWNTIPGGGDDSNGESEGGSNDTDSSSD